MGTILIIWGGSAAILSFVNYLYCKKFPDTEDKN